MAIALWSQFFSNPTREAIEKTNNKKITYQNKSVSEIQKVEDFHNPLMEKPCDENQENRWSDLCAQWKAADAAKVSASWTAFGFVFSFIGLILTIINIRYTKNAAISAEKSADTAKDSIELMRKSAIEMDRAWIKIFIKSEEILTTEENIKIKVEFCLENVGKNVVISHSFSAKIYPMSELLINEFENLPKDISYILKGTYLRPIFPNEIVTRSEEFILSRRQVMDAIHRYNSSVDPIDQIGPVNPCIVAWAPYLLPGDHTTRHTIISFCLYDQNDHLINYYPENFPQNSTGKANLKNFSMFNKLT
ncbi:hypothetical protein [Niveispirillum sp. BGYR6]|uniref:hypothetical protein n=1 Tax=Niveispirillum sp. BGYR6 TaxID=2971249 RepID=UPI0022B96A96|nr:hypothetical protein [Niveispirillum sp. BGYR6]MDG5494923.1 hypothetical protein [Niveispirillum sp. BGYR6]